MSLAFFGSSQSDVVSPAVQSTTPGEGVTWLAAGTTQAVYDLQSAPGLFSRYVDLIANGDKIWFAFGPTDNVTLDKTFTGGADVAAGTLVSNPRPLADGETLPVFLPSATSHRYLYVLADSQSAVLILSPSSPKP